LAAPCRWRATATGNEHTYRVQNRGRYRPASAVAAIPFRSVAFGNPDPRHGPDGDSVSRQNC